MITGRFHIEKKTNTHEENSQYINELLQDISSISLDCKDILSFIGNSGQIPADVLLSNCRGSGDVIKVIAKLIEAKLVVEFVSPPNTPNGQHRYNNQDMNYMTYLSLSKRGVDVIRLSKILNDI